MTATSRNVEEAVAVGRFREDLYYRLNVVTIELPSLRERRQDFPALVEHFLKRGGRTVSITPLALNRLCEYDWPGNVRELENTIERAAVLARSGMIDEMDVQQNRAALVRRQGPWTDQIPLSDGWKANVAAAEKAMLLRALRIAEGNKSRASDILGIRRRLLYEKMREFGVIDAESGDQ